MPTPTTIINRSGTSTAEITKGGRNNAFRNTVVGLVADYLVRNLGIQNCVKQEDREVKYELLL